MNSPLERINSEAVNINLFPEKVYHFFILLEKTVRVKKVQFYTFINLRKPNQIKSSITEIFGKSCHAVLDPS